MPVRAQPKSTTAIGNGVPSPKIPTNEPVTAPVVNPQAPDKAVAVALLVGKNSIILDMPLLIIKPWQLNISIISAAKIYDDKLLNRMTYKNNIAVATHWASCPNVNKECGEVLRKSLLLIRLAAIRASMLTPKYMG